ncbi:hypothetical protein DPSP01_005607 [Paraphaeosphaeria sporulosa]
MGHPLPTTGGGDQDSAADDSMQATRAAEPLVEDLDQVHADEEHAPVQQFQPSLSKTVDYSPGRQHSPTPSEEDAAAPPPDFTRRGIHIPTRTSSNTATLKKRFFRSSSLPPTTPTETAPMPTTIDSSSMRERSLRSSADSIQSFDTQASSIATHQLGPLQTKGPLEDVDRLSPLLEDDPQSFELVAPTSNHSKGFDLETRSEQLFSRDHLQAIFRDTPSLLRFTAFLSTARPKSVPVLIYYLDALKAMRAIQYANAVAEALEPIDGQEFTEHPPRSTLNAVLEDKAQQAFDILVRDELPAFITHVFIQHVSVSIQKRVTGNMPPMLREASEGLAEVFCVSDPSRSDNPIIFASEEFHRTTQYGVNFAIGRNCRFLQGPMTNRSSVTRLHNAVSEGKETSEVFLNYRRDGSPFMNLLMMAPLLDSRGNLRYFIGAQVDVSGLVKDCTDLDAFQHYLDVKEGRAPPDDNKDEFQELSEMFNIQELETVRRCGGNMHRETLDEDDRMSMRGGQQPRPRVVIKDMSAYGDEGLKSNNLPLKTEGKLQGVYKHYLLIRPAPSLRILFVSPSLRVPGILQSRFLDRIGGNTRVRNSVAEALTDSSRGVTAKIRWLSTATADLDEGQHEEGRPRWIHCTPLLGQSGAVGVWMVVLVDDEKQTGPARRFRQAPPVPNDVRRLQQQRSKHLSPEPSAYDMDSERERHSEREREGRTPMYNMGHMSGSQPRLNRNGGYSRPESAMSEQRAEPRSSNESSVASDRNRRPVRDGGMTKTTTLQRESVDPAQAEQRAGASHNGSVSSSVSAQEVLPVMTRPRTSSGAR